MVRLDALFVRAATSASEAEVTPGSRADIGEQPIGELPDACLVVAAQRRLDREAHQPAAVEAAIEMLQVVEAAREEPASSHEQHRQRHLRHHQALPHARLTDADAGGRTHFPHRLVQLDAGALQRRHEAEANRGEQGDGEREEPDAKVRRGRQGLGQGVGGQDREQQVAEPDRQQHPDQRAGGGEHEAFGQRLPDQAPSRRAQREPHGHLLLARRGPGQQQVGHVRAGDEQHEPDHRHQHHQRRREVFAGVRQPARRRVQHQRLLAEARRERLGRIRERVPELALVDLPVEDVELGLGGRRGYARPQPPHHLHEARAPVHQVVQRRRDLRLHHQRHEHVGRRRAHDPGEAWWARRRRRSWACC